jgi:hypothetical protein
VDVLEGLVVVGSEVVVDICALTIGVKLATGIPTAKPTLRESTTNLVTLLILNFNSSQKRA